MDVFSTRRSRLQLLVDQISSGNISDFAKKYGYSRAQVSQYLSEKYNDGRSIGERAARSIELNVGKSVGWLDQPNRSVEALLNTQEQDSGPVIRSQLIEQRKRSEVRFHIPVLGTFTPTADGLIEGVIGVPNEAIPFLQMYSASNGAHAFMLKGNNLTPRMRSGEYLVVDREKKAEPGDDLIAKLASGEWIIVQFLYVRDGGIFFGNINGTTPPVMVIESEIVEMMPIIAIASGQVEVSVAEPKDIS